MTNANFGIDAIKVPEMAFLLFTISGIPIVNSPT